jgi:prepilin-type N-terminal cleavage/methylation domain-containing protein
VKSKTESRKLILAIENPKSKTCPFDRLRAGSEPSRRIENGFTLLEVVIAMAIVGLGVVALMEIFSMGLRLTTASAARTEAVAYSRQVMDEFLVRQMFDGRADAGSIGKTHRWQLDVQPLRDSTDLGATMRWDINQITLRMRYPDGERDKLVEMQTLRIQKRKNK